MIATSRAPYGMVCAADHLASSAGVAMLREGGSAVDAAVAANAVLAVTSPHLCGMGGDLFALVHGASHAAPRPAALNASGRMGSGADADALRADGHTTVPFHDDIRSVPVPGCVDGWVALHDRYGRLPFVHVLAPAVSYAADGFPASPLLAAVVPLVAGADGADDFFPGGTPVLSGQVVRRPGVARALSALIADGRRGFYGGDFGRGLVRVGRGLFSAADLDRPNADWVDPLVVRVWGHDLWTVPPNSQGYLTLLGAAIAEGLELPGDTDDPAWPHLLAEAARAAGHDRVRLLHENADVRPLLESDAVVTRRALVDPQRRGRLVAPAASGDTTYVCAVDRDRMGVSLIQSNASGFGSHLFEPSTGINLQNRAIGFSLEPGHPAEYGPGRRPPHTLSPALVTGPDARLRVVLGTMGGDSQPQLLLQLLTRILRNGQSAGTAMSAPRWELAAPEPSGFNTWTEPDDVVVQLEADAPSGWAEGLRQRGHDVVVVEPGRRFGHAQLIEVEETGMLAGASDPRAMIGAAAAY